MSALSDDRIAALARRAAFGDMLVDGMRALLNAPLGDASHRDAIITCRALLQVYDEERQEAQEEWSAGVPT